MPDTMDSVQQLTADLAEDALKRHAQRPRLAGRTRCAQLDCGEPIIPERQALGAQLCMQHQRLEEAEQVHLRTWRGVY